VPARTTVFEEYSDRYDAWYDSPKGEDLLATEVACLRPLLSQLPRPHLEVGVGTGRFAEALGIEYGVDPSTRAVAIARGRGVTAITGTAESLPFPRGSFGGVLFAFTLCLVRSPLSALTEARRVLNPNGGLVLGLLLKATPWADWYARRGAEGHPIYRDARFLSKEDVEGLLETTGFEITGIHSTLFQPPQLDAYEEERPREGYVHGAGFVAIAAHIKEA
jgi:SAM-dependent methyltransferase